jgi:hypothetical protein
LKLFIKGEWEIPKPYKEITEDGLYIKGEKG